MTASRYVIGVDCSTTGAKAIVCDEGGAIHAEGRSEIPSSSPRPAWHEQEPEHWWQATLAALREAVARVDPAAVGAIGITHQRETFACLDEQGSPLRPGITWFDSRCLEQVRRHGSTRLHELTGKVPDPTPALYKLYWLNEHEPGLVARAHRVIDVHGYLVGRLTGHWSTSWASADPLGLVDMKRFDYSDEILADVGLRRAQLPALVAPGETVGVLTPEVSKTLGLGADVVVVAGAGDGQCAGLGADVTAPGSAYLNLGTAVVSGTHSDQYMWGKAFRTLASPLRGAYTLETLLRSGTYLVDWFTESLCPTLGSAVADVGLTAEEALEAAAAKIPPGSAGLVALPYWSGAQTPYWDIHARGMLFGLQGAHGKAHVYRALLEAVAFQQRLHTDSVADALGHDVTLYKAMGGGSRSALWCQMMADVTGRALRCCPSPEITALGAAVLAAVGAGWYADAAEAAGAMSRFGAQYEPRDAESATYDRIYRNVYLELYQRVSDLYPALE